MPNGGHERLESIQVLRAVAALAVIWSHSTLELLRFTDVDLRSFSSLSSMGRTGVDIFFVISGFVMVYVSSRHFQKGHEASRFLFKRVVRVVPIYWFYTSLILGVALLAPNLLRNFELSWAHVAASYFFIPFPTPGDDGFHPLLGVGWTLNYEMFFYVLFAPFLFLAREKGILALAALFVAIVLAGQLLTPSAGAFWFWSRPIILEFAGGCLLALAFLRGWRFSTLWAVLIVASGLGWLVYVAEYWNEGGLDARLFVTGVPSILIVAGIALRRRTGDDGKTSMASRAFVHLGDASYSLYLVHMFVIRTLTKLVPVDLLGVIYPFVYMIAVFALCILAATLSYRLIERPANSGLRKWANI
ncbi:MAG: acyltransferase [Parvibaculum sp.]